MDRTDRLLLEQHIRDLDGIQRTLADMRSVLVRRMRRMEQAPPIQTRLRMNRINTPPRQEPVPRQDPVNLMGAFQFVNSDDETDDDGDSEWFEGGVARQRE